jgi:hypothetical protein
VCLTSSSKTLLWGKRKSIDEWSEGDGDVRECREGKRKGEQLGEIKMALNLKMKLNKIIKELLIRHLYVKDIIAWNDRTRGGVVWCVRNYFFERAS